MKTEDIIKELELNYGYTFTKEGTDNKWQFEWICEMINDVQNVVTKNCNLQNVSNNEVAVCQCDEPQFYADKEKDWWYCKKCKLPRQTDC